jgi:hypothetical protein|tara:strand:- start:62 stop:613 length:552 start_codon:yes stop_codon:yes gene_type:complete
MNEYQLFDNVTRWLNHEGYEYSKDNVEKLFHIKKEETLFLKKIKNYYGVHIFEPKEQKGILVIGIEIKIPGSIHKSYHESYVENDKKNLMANLENYAMGIGAIHRFYPDPNAIKSGVYIVLDSKQKLNFESFMESMKKIVIMEDSMNTFLNNLKGSKGAGDGKPSQSSWVTRWGSKWQDVGSI